MTGVKSRKPYVSPRRAERLDATRRRILEVARRLFAERGYASTTMEAIAAGSDLAVPTVYKNFGNKRLLLLCLVDQTINIHVTSEQKAVESEPSPRGRIDALAHMCVKLASSAADVISVVISAAGSDPEFRKLVAAMSEDRRRNAGRIARSLAKDGALRAGLSVAEASDVMFALAGPEMYNLLVTDSGWSERRFETQIADAMAALVLGNGLLAAS